MIIIEEIDKTVSDLEQEYKDYLYSHINAVNQSWKDILKPALLNKDQDLVDPDDPDFDIDEIELQIQDHDHSKFDDEEFDGYRKWWYPTDDSEKDETLYNQAWNHHQRVNPHHWQYWCFIRDSGDIETLDMPFNYICEMVCDWHSFSLKNPESTAYQWYNDNRNIMKISDRTRSTVEKLVELFKEPLK